MREFSAQRPLVGAFLLVLAQAGVAECPAQWTVEAGARLVQSDWREFSSQGAELLHESGLLRGSSLGAEMQCSGWRLALRAVGADGNRDYMGQTQAGVPLATLSELRHSDFALEVGRALWESVELMGSLRSVEVQRNILSTASANGYPERYRWSVAALGVLGRWPITDYDTLHAAVTWGAGRNQSMTVWLPNRDAATLSLGEITETAVSLAWRHRLTPQWALMTQWELQKTRIGQGDAGAIFRNGVPVGVAYQPQSEMTQQHIGLTVQYSIGGRKP